MVTKMESVKNTRCPITTSKTAFTKLNAIEMENVWIKKKEKQYAQAAKTKYLSSYISHVKF